MRLILHRTLRSIDPGRARPGPRACARRCEALEAVFQHAMRIARLDGDWVAVPRVRG
jgi:hypothetical protein